MLRRLAVLAAAGLLLPACSTIDSINPFSEKKAPRLEGVRQPVLVGEELVRPDTALANRSVVLPNPTTNAEWPQAGGYPDHAMHHLTLSAQPKVAWQSSIGSATTGGSFFRTFGLSTPRRLIAQPIVAAGKFFALNSAGEVVALDAATGGSVWRTNILPKDENEGDIGGGIGFANGVLYVASGAAEVLALSPADGRILWRTAIGAPSRGAPTISGGRIYVVTTENELIALDPANKGARLWNFSGVAEPTGILGAANAAVEGNVVIMPESSGEIVALRAESGRQIWTERLAAARQINPITNIADITARPVVDRGMVIAVSNAGRLAALDILTGRRLWDIDIGGIQTPWIAGDWLYALSNEGQLVCIERTTGRIKWSIQLNNFASEKQRRNLITWTGPVLASDRLIVAGSHGEALSLSPYTGQVLGRFVIGERVLISPIAANGTIYFLDDTG
ncbi:MAG: PQQ-binding-like beta-propeller repeat protein, partial [Rhodospirillaceae bacterium]|nr:PQQ-binding-like beta-propeller repeat protein [Rhodospirillaceae bacterium]